MTPSKLPPPTGSKPGPKSPAKRKRAAPLPKVDLDALAAELVPTEGAQRVAMRRMLEGLYQSEDNLRTEALAGNATAARALNETRRVLNSVLGFVRVGRPPNPKSPTGEDAREGSQTDVPIWVPVSAPPDQEPDDADLSDLALKSIEGDGSA